MKKDIFYSIESTKKDGPVDWNNHANRDKLVNFKYDKVEEIGYIVYELRKHSPLFSFSVIMYTKELTLI